MSHPNLEDVIEKINEIIDAVNANSLGLSMPFEEYRYISNGKEFDSVMHGRWVSHGSYFTCSVCGEEQYGIDTGRYYCQNCGAKMDGEK